MVSLDRSLLTERPGYLEGEAKTVAARAGETVTEYKQLVCKRYISINPEQLEHRLGGNSYQVTRKYDGELAVLFYDGTEVYTVNTGGRVRLGLGVHDEALTHLKKAGVKQAVIPAELYVAEDAGRTRVFDVSAVLADPARHGELRLGVFDIISTDGEEHRPGSYTETHGWLSQVFTGPTVHPVEMVDASSRQQVIDLCTSWVTEGGAEGLVVRTDLPIVYKVKPVYTLDVAVIGYSENPDKAGQVRSLLVALATPDGRYQPVGHVGSGLNETSRSELHATLSPSEVASSYIETDTNHVAFHMVKPELVLELRINDVLFESTNGPVFNPLLEFNGSWSRTGTATGLSILHPVLVRVRDDKAPSGADVRLEQIEQYWSWPLPPQQETAAAVNASTVLRREVYTKRMGGKLMVQKFLVWRTNKQAGYPAYVLAYTNYSSGRAQPLSTEVRISDHEDQVLAMADDLVADKVKSGWALVE